MYVLGLDLETTGLVFAEDEIIELGAVVWDTESNKPVAMLNHLVKQASKLPLSKRIVGITGIQDEDLLNFGEEEYKVVNEFVALAKKCEFIVAHNGHAFDKIYIDKVLKRHGLELSTPWIDIMFDVPFKTGSKKLTYLAAEHNFLNPFSHRALFDVLTMLKVCSEYSWDDIVARSKSLTVIIIAKVSKEDRQLAKEKGFHWDPKNYQWFKTLKECDLDDKEFTFDIEIKAASLD